jgi:hypothetical protein
VACRRTEDADRPSLLAALGLHAASDLLQCLPDLPSRAASAPHPLAALRHNLQQMKEEEAQDPEAAVMADMLLVELQ